MKINRFTLICAIALSAPAIASADIPMDEAMEMRGFYGIYPVSREASGTSWQPEMTPVPGTIGQDNELLVFYRGFINGGYILQTGERGEDGEFTTSMFSILAQNPVEDGVLGVRLRFSLDRLNGTEGYPLLLQNGGTSDGSTRLIDRQYPRNLLSEGALTFSYSIRREGSIRRPTSWRS